jgi:glutathione peroxidase-family protein
MYVYPASLGERFIPFHSTPFVKSLEQSLTLMRLLANDEIQEFCQINYGVSFPVLGKIDVNGDKADPAFEWLKNEKPGLMGLKRVKWNFEKFLVGRDGKVKGRWASTKKPEDLKADIEKEIKAGKA